MNWLLYLDLIAILVFFGSALFFYLHWTAYSEEMDRAHPYVNRKAMISASYRSVLFIYTAGCLLTAIYGIVRVFS